MCLLVPRRMSERSDRLMLAFNSWSKRTKLTRAQTRERFGWNRVTFNANLNGNAPFSYDSAKDYARAFGVRAEWLYDGQEPMLPIGQTRRQTIDVPLIGWVSAAALHRRARKIASQPAEIQQ